MNIIINQTLQVNNIATLQPYKDKVLKDKRLTY